MIQGNLKAINVIHHESRELIMQYFQPILIGIGILAIAGVLIHGFLLNKKNNTPQDELFDERNKDDHYSSDENDDRETESLSFSEQSAHEKEALAAFQSNLNQQEHLHELEPVILKTNFSKEDLFELPKRVHLPVDEPISSSTKVELNEQIEQEKSAPTVQKQTETDLFIFNVVAKNDERLGGHELLQFFLTSGFRYGDMNIFHRHEYSDGTGEILFSIANMMAPGTFDLDTMEQFNSPGISFFFTAPNDKISVNNAFDMMLRAVEQVAEEFDCDVLDATREKFTQEQFLDYRDRLKKYK